MNKHHGFLRGFVGLFSCIGLLGSMLLKNIFAEKLAILTQNTAVLCKNITITLNFKEIANFFAENWSKSPKIVIITLPLGTGPTLKA
jgi:hypothetical protein